MVAGVPTVHPAEVVADPTAPAAGVPTVHPAEVVADPTAPAAGVPTAHPAEVVADPTAHPAEAAPTPAVVADPMARPLVGRVDLVAPEAEGLRMQQQHPHRH